MLLAYMVHHGTQLTPKLLWVEVFQEPTQLSRTMITSIKFSQLTPFIFPKLILIALNSQLIAWWTQLLCLKISMDSLINLILVTMQSVQVKWRPRSLHVKKFNSMLETSLLTSTKKMKLEIAAQTLMIIVSNGLMNISAQPQNQITICMARSLSLVMIWAPIMKVLYGSGLTWVMKNLRTNLRWL